jgi:hypothetical protein
VETEESDTEQVIMELYTPNNVVSQMDKRMGYKLAGNLINLVNDMNLFANHGPYLGETINRV